jgi:hypothetical protein
VTLDPDRLSYWGVTLVSAARTRTPPVSRLDGQRAWAWLLALLVCAAVWTGVAFGLVALLG